MKSPLLKRLEKVEQNLKPEQIRVCLPVSWYELSQEEREDRIERWRHGEDFGDYDPHAKGMAAVYSQGMRSDLTIEERRNAIVFSIRFV